MPTSGRGPFVAKGRGEAEAPLILLGKIGRLDLLESLAASLVVPQSVIREIGAGAEADTTAVATAAWALRWAVAILDDGEVRSCAQSLDLPIIGTLGIILRARKQDLLPAARPLVDQILAAGSHINRELVEGALAKIGE